MKNKDTLLLETCYNKVQGHLIKEGIEDIEFVQEIRLDYIGSEEADRESIRELGVHKDNLTLRYKVDMEVRKWGIKSIRPYGMKLEAFTVTKMDDDFQEKNVKKFDMVDLSGAQINVSDGSGLYPSSIVLFLDSNLNVVPEKCTVNFN